MWSIEGIYPNVCEQSTLNWKAPPCPRGRATRRVAGLDAAVTGLGRQPRDNSRYRLNQVLVFLGLDYTARPCGALMHRRGEDNSNYFFLVKSLTCIYYIWPCTLPNKLSLLFFIIANHFNVNSPLHIVNVCVINYLVVSFFARALDLQEFQRQFTTYERIWKIAIPSKYIVSNV